MPRNNCRTKWIRRLVAGVVLLICLAASPASAWDKKYFSQQELAAIRQHLRYRAYGHLSFDYLEPREDYGSWSGGTLGLAARINDYVSVFGEGTGFVRTGGVADGDQPVEPRGEGVLATLGMTLTPSEYLWANTALSFGSNSLFLPKFRVDQDLTFGIPLADTVTLGITPGVFYAQYFTDNETFGYFIGPGLYFYSWQLGYSFVVSESWPGDHVGYTHTGFVGFSRDGWFNSFVTFSFGDVNYLDNRATVPAEVDDTYWQVGWNHQHWLGVNWGLSGGLRYGEYVNEYRVYGGQFGLFYEF